MKSNCAYCHKELDAVAHTVSCPHCQTKYHADCWQENRSRCAVLGCIGASNYKFQGFLNDNPTYSEKESMKSRKVIECAHCRGKTLCYRGNWGKYSCSPCRNEYEISSEYEIVFCSVCKGLGEITVPHDARQCLHCDGGTLCLLGNWGKYSCPPCRNEYGISSEYKIVFCSRCKGTGYVHGYAT